MQAQDLRPAAGITIDESRTVALLAVAPRSCVAVALPGATVYLDRAELERRVAAKPAAWTTEPERRALIDGNRAQRLLSQASTSDKNDPGCAVASGPLSGDAQGAVLSALEGGTAAVRNVATGAMVAAVRIRYHGDRSGPSSGRGSISVHLPEVAFPFLMVSWWVS